MEEGDNIYERRRRGGRLGLCTLMLSLPYMWYKLSSVGLKVRN